MLKKIYFDRAFYNWKLIDNLNKSNFPYIIFVPKNKKIKSFIEQTEQAGSNMESYNHEGKYSKDKSTFKAKTTIVACKDTRNKDTKNEDYDGEYYKCFATNLDPDEKMCEYYSGRWNIETLFRVMKDAKIKTKSNDPLIRFFYFSLRAVFVLAWTVRKQVKEKILRLQLH